MRERRWETRPQNAPRALVAFASAELRGQAPFDADREDAIATWVEMVMGWQADTSFRPARSGATEPNDGSGSATGGSTPFPNERHDGDWHDPEVPAGDTEECRPTRQLVPADDPAYQQLFAR